MSVGKDSLKRAANAATTKEEKATATKTTSKKVATKKTEIKTEAENKDVTAVVNTGTSEEVKEMFAPKERVSHVSEELPVYLL